MLASRAALQLMSDGEPRGLAVQERHLNGNDAKGRELLASIAIMVRRDRDECNEMDGRQADRISTALVTAHPLEHRQRMAATSYSHLRTAAMGASRPRFLCQTLL